MTSPSIPDDFALLDAWQQGDSKAGNRLFERHFDAIYRFFANKTGHDGADLVQRTFLGCIEARDRFRRTSSFRTFLFAIARNELRAHWRQRRKHEQVDFGVSSLKDLGASPSSLARRRDDTQRLVDALHAIPVDQQIALELHYLHGLSGPQLAVVLEVPEGTVRSRLQRARENLRQRVLDHSGAAVKAATIHDVLAADGPDWERHVAALMHAM